jgi:hypothetical protein
MCSPENPCKCYDITINDHWEAIEGIAADVGSMRK